jgi:hypothetical protein
MARRSQFVGSGHPSHAACVSLSGYAKKEIGRTPIHRDPMYGLLTIQEALRAQGWPNPFFNVRTF